MAKQKTDVDIESELRVKNILEERGILMKDFADKIGITRETLTRALKGNPQYSTLKAIADGLNLSVPELFIPKPKDGKDVRGYIEVEGIIYKISSKEDLLKVIEII